MGPLGLVVLLGHVGLVVLMVLVGLVGLMHLYMSLLCFVGYLYWSASFGYFIGSNFFYQTFLSDHSLPMSIILGSLFSLTSI